MEYSITTNYVIGFIYMRRWTIRLPSEGDIHTQSPVV